MHMLAWKMHLCWLPGAWLLERLWISTKDALPWGPHLPIISQVHLALHTHLVKRSQEPEPWSTSRADH